MTALHLICRLDPTTKLPKGLTVVDRARRVYRSCCWAISDDEALALVDGGWLYLHERKSDVSHFGGRVEGCDVAYVDDAAHERRFAITFQARAEGREQPWRGASHAMAWSSGLICQLLPHEH